MSGASTSATVNAWLPAGRYELQHGPGAVRVGGELDGVAGGARLAALPVQLHAGRGDERGGQVDGGGRAALGRRGRAPGQRGEEYQRREDAHYFCQNWMPLHTTVIGPAPLAVRYAPNLS